VTSAAIEIDFLEGFHHAPHAFVHALNPGGIHGLSLALSFRNFLMLGDHLRLGLQGSVHAVVREVEGERAVAVFRMNSTASLVSRSVRYSPGWPSGSTFHLARKPVVGIFQLSS